MSVKVEYLAVEKLISWLRLTLPAKVAEVNASRAAVLESPQSGPFTIPVGAVLKVSTSKKDADFTSVVLTAGTRTATQVAADVAVEISNLGSSDSESRLALTSTNAPTNGTPSVISVGPDTTGANAALGWNPGGEYVINTALVAPGHRNVMDGWPQQLDSTAGFIVVVGRRRGLPVSPELRRDESVVTLELSLFRPAVQQENHRSREHVHACLQCVREVLTTDRGRQLGREATGDVVLVELGPGSVEAMRFQPMQKGKPFGPAFDSAQLTVYVKTFERPAQT